MASALARLTELKELRLYLSNNVIGPGPRRALCSDPEKVEARERQLHGRRIIVPSALATRGRSVAGWGFISLSPEVMQAPQQWRRACGICGSSRSSRLACATMRSARASWAVKRP